MRLQISAPEIAAGALRDATVATAADALRVDGYVVLGGVVDLAALDAMKAKLDADTADLLSRTKERGAIPGHLSQSMPRSRAHIHRSIVANDFVIQVTAAVLGEGVHNHFYNCNTNLPRSNTQPLHRDAAHLWPDPIHPITSIIVNISPIDVDEKNGATELWPGTQRLLGSTRIGRSEEKARRASEPPVRVVTRKGDAVLRDPRQWHRGVPNRGREARHMIAMVHSKWFYESETCIPVTRDALDAFDHEVLTTRVELVPDDYDYLSEVVETRRF
ncbi:MAG: phytanoyl-CoA dioxygenase family protein [Gemmatimonadaceae bacterium]